MKASPKTMVFLAACVLLLAVAPCRAQQKPSPFEDPKFDPDKEQIEEVVLRPGKPSDIDMSIPYPARKGGLRVRFRLDGPDAALLKAYVRVDKKDRPVVIHGGEFDVIVPEGGTQLLIWLLWDGKAASGQRMALNTTILDPQGTPTHVTRLSQWVTLRN